MIKNQTINFVFEDVRFFLPCQLQEMDAFFREENHHKTYFTIIPFY